MYTSTASPRRLQKWKPARKPPPLHTAHALHAPPARRKWRAPHTLALLSRQSHTHARPHLTHPTPAPTRTHVALPALIRKPFENPSKTLLSPRTWTSFFLPALTATHSQITRPRARGLEKSPHNVTHSRCTHTAHSETARPAEHPYRFPLRAPHGAWGVASYPHLSLSQNFNAASCTHTAHTRCIATFETAPDLTTHLSHVWRRLRESDHAPGTHGVAGAYVTALITFSLACFRIGRARDKVCIRHGGQRNVTEYGVTEIGETMTWGHFYDPKQHGDLVVAHCSCGWTSALAFGGRDPAGDDVGERMAWQTFKTDHLEHIAVLEQR